jgi:hypothetical protein
VADAPEFTSLDAIISAVTHFRALRRF